MLDAGDLTTRGALRQRVSAPDGQGGHVVTWRTVATLWADIRAMTGLEQFAADQQAPLVRYDITIRFRPGVTPAPYGADPTMRFVVGARTFDIRTVIDLDEAHEALVLGCELYAP